MKQESLNRLQEIGGNDLVLKIIALFFQHVPERMITLKQGLAENNSDTVMRMAHSIKSSAANLGLEALENLSQEVESLANKGQIDGCRSLLEPIEEALKNALVTLSEIQKKLEH